MGWLLTSNQAELCGIRHYLWIIDIFFVDSSFSVTLAFRCSYWKLNSDNLAENRNAVETSLPSQTAWFIRLLFGQFSVCLSTLNRIFITFKIPRSM